MTTTRPGFRPRFDTLEDRSTPAQFGVPWADPTHLTLSFAPDGTAAVGTPSRLFGALDPAVGRAAWQGAVLRAVQTWSELANVNVGVVADGGQPFGATGPTQGDPRFGDIRVGGLPMTPGELAEAVPPDPFVSGTLAGDIFVNTAAAHTAAGLYAVALHEVGHALGLPPSTDPRSVMFNTLNPAAVPTAADVAAIRALYGARAPDANDADRANDTIKRATRLEFPERNSVHDPTLPAVGYGDITTRADADVFLVKPEFASAGPMTVRVQTAGISLLAARVTVLDEGGRVLGQSGTAGNAGGSASVTLSSVNPRAKYYVRVEAAPGAGVGRYAVAATLDWLVKPAALPLDAVLRGPYETLSSEEMWELFRDPTHALYDDDLYTNETALAATNLPGTPGYAANTHFRTVGSLAGPADVDVYRIRTPDTRIPQVLTVRLRAVGPGGVAPRVEVLDANLAPVPVTILSNGNGTFAVQATGLPADRASYYVRAFGGPAGNYALDAGFGTAAAASKTFATGTLAGPGRQSGYTLYVGQTQLLGLALDVTGPAGSGAVRMTITDAAGMEVLGLTAAAGDTATGLSVLLRPGQYAVRFESVAGTGPAGPLSFRVRGATLTDPVGPVTRDPTLAPQYATPGSPGTYTYPSGTVTTLPFLWVFGFSI